MRKSPRSSKNQLAMVARLTCAVLSLFASGCFQAQYIAQQAGGQWHLLRYRQRIADVLADPRASAELKRRLRLSQAARDFGVHVLGLRGGDAYTRYYDSGGKPIAWNVAAAEKDRLKAYLVKFPIAGAVPYLGYFKQADALAKQRELDEAGLDTSVRGVVGYSTLGMTADPVYSSMLEGPDYRIVEVTLHEMLHGTVYLGGRSEWNESFATFVGFRGAALFFGEVGDGAEVRRVLAEAEKAEARQEGFSRFLEPFARELEALYASGHSRAEKLQLREPIFERIRAEYKRQFPPRPGARPGGFAEALINNAVIVGWAVYHRSMPEHRRIYSLLGGDLAAMIRLYQHEVEDDADPIGALKAWRPSTGTGR